MSSRVDAMKFSAKILLIVIVWSTITLALFPLFARHRPPFEDGGARALGVSSLAPPAHPRQRTPASAPHPRQRSDTPPTPTSRQDGNVDNAWSDKRSCGWT